MEGDVIFIRRGPDLVPLEAAPYEAEAALQDLLERHSQLLAGYQMSRDDPRRFLLVRREAPVPDRDSGSGRWSIDHLFLDQDAIPTLVEVKRSTDSRIRREVVGQMLDYAANGARHWVGGTLRELFERTCAGAGKDHSAVLEEVIGTDGDVEEFWAGAERNLRAGVLRLVFVADVIPDELRAVIEFLNERMQDTEVYGVEVRRYGNADIAECFVPRLIGATAAATTRNTSLAEKLRIAGPEVAAAAERMQALGEQIGLSVREVPASLRLFDSLGTVVLLYPTYRTLEFPLERLHQAGRDGDIASVRQSLQRVAGGSRQVTQMSPNVGCREALAHWDQVAEIVRTLARARAEIA